MGDAPTDLVCIARLAPQARYAPMGSNRGHATTDTDVRFNSRFETSGEFHRDIPPPTPRSEATVCAVVGREWWSLAWRPCVSPACATSLQPTFNQKSERCRSVGKAEPPAQPLSSEST